MNSTGMDRFSIYAPTADDIAGLGAVYGTGPTSGQPYVVWENAKDSTRAIWGMANGIQTSSIYLPTLPAEWPIAGAGDFLGNGLQGLVWENLNNGMHAIWILRNGVTTSSFYLPTMSLQWRTAAVADFDGDGQADFAWENTLTGEHAIWLLNQGNIKSTFYLPGIPTSWHLAAAGDFLGKVKQTLSGKTPRPANGQSGSWITGRSALPITCLAPG
jgi:hypothetical protein